MCTAFVLLSCVNCWCRVLHGSARGSSFPSSTQQTQSTFGSSYSLSSTSTHLIQQCFSCLRRQSLPLCQHDQTPISASKHLCPCLLKKPSVSSFQLLISTSMAYRHIPTMTDSHHGGFLSVMIMVGICQVTNSHHK